MKEYKITVIYTKEPRKERRTLETVGSIARRVLRNRRTLMFGGLVGFLLIAGTPHVGWDYECRHPFSPTRPCTSFVYCGYYGIQGRRVVFPDYDESCKLIKLLPPDWNKLLNSL